jgi:hypothetical protein
LKSLLKDRVEASLMASKLACGQVAFRENLKDIEGELFGSSICGLSPLSNELKESLILSSKRVNFSENITLSLKKKHWLCLEVK